jgi:hypothetical protein
MDRLEEKVVRTLVRLGTADRDTLLGAVEGDRRAANNAIGKLIDRGDFRITLDWKLTPAPGLRNEE